MNQNVEFEFVPRNEAKPCRQELEAIIKKVQNFCKEKDKSFTFQFYLVGSQNRHLVTRIKNGNLGYDFDYNLSLNCEDGYFWKPKYARKLIFDALQESIKGTLFNKIENSTSVITIKCVKKNKIIVSCDFSIIYYTDDQDDDYYKYVRFNKNQGDFTWEERKLSRNIDDKLDWLYTNVDGYWDEIKSEYLKLKDSNKDPNKYSFVLYYETICNLFNHYYYQIYQSVNEEYDDDDD